MRWLKHMTDTRHDEKIARLIDHYGMAGYGMWWAVLEVVAAKLDHKTHPQPSVTYPISTWASLLSLRGSHVRREIAKLELNHLVITTWNTNELTVTIPNLLKYRDEYTQKSGRTPDALPSKNQNQIQSQKTESEPEILDDSHASRTPRAKTRECPSRSPSQDGNGLTPISEFAAEVTITTEEEIKALRAEMEAIRGQPPTHSAVVKVKEALGTGSIRGFVDHLHGVPARYRPGGHQAVHAWEWFVAAANNYTASPSVSRSNAEFQDVPF